MSGKSIEEFINSHSALRPLHLRFSGGGWGGHKTINSIICPHFSREGDCPLCVLFFVCVCVCVCVCVLFFYVLKVDVKMKALSYSWAFLS